MDHYMAIFISHPILVRGRCISAGKLSGLRADIQGPRAKIGCDIKIAMFFYTPVFLTLYDNM